MSCIGRAGFAYFKDDKLQLRASYYRVRNNEIKINLYIINITIQNKDNSFKNVYI